MRLPDFTMKRLRDLALVAIIVLNVIATVVSFEESYAGLYQWAHQHNILGFNAGVWPLMVDLIILVAEAGLFVAHHDHWKARHKAWLWGVLGVALAVSVGGNTGHIRSTDWLSHLTAGLPPAALFFTMSVGFGVMKRTFLNKPVIQAVETVSDSDLASIRAKLDEITPARETPLNETPVAASHEVAESPLIPFAETPETPATEITENADERLSETMVSLGFKATEKSFTMPKDPREGLTLPEKRVRDMYDVDPDISVNAIAVNLGIAWATAKKYLDATKEARGLTI